MIPHLHLSLRPLRSVLIALLGAALVASFVVVITTASAQAARNYRVTAKANVTTLTLGSTGLIRGNVKPAAPKQRVFLQQLVRRDWTTIRAKRLTKKSKYKMVMNPTKPGVNQFRVCKKAFKRIRAACTGPVRVTVFRWHYLTDFDAVASDDLEEEDTLSINGVNYKKSLMTHYFFSTSAYREYNLDRKCIALKGVAGIEDSSRSGSRGQLEILTDGNSLLNQTLTLGSATPFSLNVTNAFRLRFEATVRDDDTRGIVAVGSPQVYCAQ